MLTFLPPPPKVENEKNNEYVLDPIFVIFWSLPQREGDNYIVPMKTISS